MRGPHAGKPPGFCLDHRLEVVAAVGTLLVEVAPDRGEIVLGKCFSQECLLGGAGRRSRSVQRSLGRMEGEKRTVVKPAQGRTT